MQILLPFISASEQLFEFRIDSCFTPNGLIESISFPLTKTVDFLEFVVSYFLVTRV